MGRRVKVDAVYRHFKGSLYKVIGVAEHTENGEKLVIYQDIHNEDKVWARPYESFIEKLPDNYKNNYKQAYRFVEVKSKKCDNTKYKGNITVWKNNNAVILDGGKPKEFTDVEQAIKCLRANGFTDKNIINLEFRVNNSEVYPISIFTLMRCSGLI